MWVDDYYGVPMKVRVTSSGTTSDYQFEDIAFNSVEDADLEHGFVTVTYTN
jgi:outer membrane lipoprotein-sorting protein